MEPLNDLRECAVCPRECRVDRTRGERGICNTDDSFPVASICLHRGEEPVISGRRGICNVFFSHCNLQCEFCQNYQISQVSCGLKTSYSSLQDILDAIVASLAAGAKAVGFVSPSHVVPQMKVIIAALREFGYTPRLVYNTNGYDRRDTVTSLDGIIDVWLPDLKYLDNDLARRYSHAPGYVEAATTSIKEMYYQKGTSIHLDDDDEIESGLIIRHLVLPGEVDNSKAVLRWIAEALSPSVHVSLMSQYHPIPQTAGHATLGRTLRRDEYEEVVEEFHALGFYRGWVQELDSPSSYRPDFTDGGHPFET
ncbi:MAG: radical SAM protein [candidate division Zixibacteria bacterium]|nr:radical SAM protein [candidate division Zixibacteria bacterium]